MVQANLLAFQSYFFWVIYRSDDAVDFNMLCDRAGNNYYISGIILSVCRSNVCLGNSLLLFKHCSF
jgi:hypothetical protein